MVSFLPFGVCKHYSVLTLLERWRESNESERGGEEESMEWEKQEQHHHYHHHHRRHHQQQEELEQNANVSGNGNGNGGVLYMKVMTDAQMEILRKQISVYATICEQLVEMHKSLTSHQDLAGLPLSFLCLSLYILSMMPTLPGFFFFWFLLGFALVIFLFFFWVIVALILFFWKKNQHILYVYGFLFPGNNSG